MEKLFLFLLALVGIGFMCNVLIYVIKAYIAHRQKQMPEIEKKRPVVVDTFVPTDYYSEKLADSCISNNDYRFDPNRRDIFIQASSDTGLLGELWSRLMCINFKDNPKKLPHDMENWFIQNIDNFIKYGETMAFIEHYPLLENLFLEHLKLPEQNTELQKRLISVCIVGQWRINYVNLLIKYLSNWELQPQIKAIVFCDERFERVKNIYKIYRQNIY